ncbi:putative iron-regulated protein [Faunimonas pinastri]|uniref:Putative iron-regulated protein n=1 Tax=Faunimonas pinastri TaxID=1855383 RepID=A0A1H9LUL6_9HYPH|nr:imelysin family protein [Faunimonas pinastri]SER15104.1 putative iron-regulated protein [Faunimonas pinastri]
MNYKKHLFGLAAAVSLTAVAVFSSARAAETPAAPTAPAVLTHYADLANIMYGDAAKSAAKLKTAVDAFVANPNDATLAAARTAWKAARVPYMQTEGFRFGNKIVDDWEGEVNSWPLDEGLIDYVDTKSYGTEKADNPLYTANIIANKQVRMGPDMVDTSTITKDVLKKFETGMGNEANVSTGYHAIEFLLWGQDLNGTGPGAGNRPASDYGTENCTHGNCDRRAAYLQAATDLLVDDLNEMTADWAKDGSARKDLIGKGEAGGLATIMTGLGSLSYGELAGERMKLGVLLHDPEEEHDCFSDNTHNSHYYDEVGIQDIWNGTYKDTDGKVHKGASLHDLAAAKSADGVKRVDDAMKVALDKIGLIKKTADSGEMAYDQMLAAGNDKGNKLVLDGVDALVAQTRALEAVVAALDLKVEVEGSDSLDNPSAVSSQ